MDAITYKFTAHFDRGGENSIRIDKEVTLTSWALARICLDANATGLTEENPAKDMDMDLQRRLLTGETMDLKSITLVRVPDTTTLEGVHT